MRRIVFAALAGLPLAGEAAAQDRSAQPAVPPVNETDYPWRRVKADELYRALSLRYVAQNCNDNPFGRADIEKAEAAIARSEPENRVVRLASEYYLKGAEAKFGDLAERCRALTEIARR